MAQYTQQDAVNALTKTNETLVKIANEVDALIATNKQLQEALAAAGGPGGTITDDLAKAIKATDDRVNAIEEVTPDAPQPEKA